MGRLVVSIATLVVAPEVDSCTVVAAEVAADDWCTVTSVVSSVVLAIVLCEVTSVVSWVLVEISLVAAEDTLVASDVRLVTSSNCTVTKMFRNKDIIEWLKQYIHTLGEKCDFYGNTIGEMHQKEQMNQITAQCTGLCKIFLLAKWLVHFSKSFLLTCSNGQTCSLNCYSCCCTWGWFSLKCTLCGRSLSWNTVKIYHETDSPCQ